jgi:hypothetical protein
MTITAIINLIHAVLTICVIAIIRNTIGNCVMIYVIITTVIAYLIINLIYVNYSMRSIAYVLISKLIRIHLINRF